MSKRTRLSLLAIVLIALGVAALLIDRCAQTVAPDATETATTPRW